MYIINKFFFIFSLILFFSINLIFLLLLLYFIVLIIFLLFSIKIAKHSSNTDLTDTSSQSCASLPPTQTSLLIKQTSLKKQVDINNNNKFSKPKIKLNDESLNSDDQHATNSNDTEDKEHDDQFDASFKDFKQSIQDNFQDNLADYFLFITCLYNELPRMNNAWNRIGFDQNTKNAKLRKFYADLTVSFLFLNTVEVVYSDIQGRHQIYVTI